MAATTGTLHASIASKITKRSGALPASPVAISLMSAPALKARFWAPVITTIDIASLLCTWVSASSMATRTSWLRGLRGGLHSLGRRRQQGRAGGNRRGKQVSQGRCNTTAVSADCEYVMEAFTMRRHCTGGQRNAVTTETRAIKRH